VSVHICPIGRIAAPGGSRNSPPLQPVHSPFTGSGTTRTGRPQNGWRASRTGCRAGNSASRFSRPDRPAERAPDGRTRAHGGTIRLTSHARAAHARADAEIEYACDLLRCKSPVPAFAPACSIVRKWVYALDS